MLSQLRIQRARLSRLCFCLRIWFSCHLLLLPSSSSSYLYLPSLFLVSHVREDSRITSSCDKELRREKVIFVHPSSSLILCSFHTLLPSYSSPLILFSQRLSWWQSVSCHWFYHVLMSAASTIFSLPCHWVFFLGLNLMFQSESLFFFLPFPCFSLPDNESSEGGGEGRKDGMILEKEMTTKDHTLGKKKREEKNVKFNVFFMFSLLLISKQRVINQSHGASSLWLR